MTNKNLLILSLMVGALLAGTVFINQQTVRHDPVTKSVVTEQPVKSFPSRADSEKALRLMNLVSNVGALIFCEQVKAITSGLDIDAIVPRLATLSEKYGDRDDALKVFKGYALEVFGVAIAGTLVTHTLLEDNSTVNRQTLNISSPEQCVVILAAIRQEQTTGEFIKGIGLPGKNVSINPKQ